jgi:hypothetical protein
MRSQSHGSKGAAARTNRLRHLPGNVDVAVTSLEKRLSEVEQLADAQSREVRIPFERIAQLQAEWDIVRIRSSKSGSPKRQHGLTRGFGRM